MSWRTHPAWVAKVEQLDLRVRSKFEDFLDALDARPIPFALGDTRRDLAREWELWKMGRRAPEEADPTNPHAWVIIDHSEVVTRVPPGMGQGPHFFGLAGDVYPIDQHGALMSTHDLAWLDTITQMWTLAEACGLDALGHAEPDVQGDEYWSGDPCHFQAQGWRAMVAADATKEV
jgi:hypothetical protein